MSAVTDHYDYLLATHYTWMFGTSFADKVAEQKSILTQALQSLTSTVTDGVPHPSQLHRDGWDAGSRTPLSLAVDLGSGPGFQSIALAQLGFSPVIAIDTSAQLLAELNSHAATLPIQTHHADLRDLPNLVPAAQATIIVCMGDTLTHLPTKQDVTTLFHAIYKTLAPGGIFILTWRDLTPELRAPIASSPSAATTTPS